MYSIFLVAACQVICSGCKRSSNAKKSAITSTVQLIDEFTNVNAANTYVDQQSKSTLSSSPASPGGSRSRASIGNDSVGTRLFRAHSVVEMRGRSQSLDDASCLAAAKLGLQVRYSNLSITLTET